LAWLGLAWLGLAWLGKKVNWNIWLHFVRCDAVSCWDFVSLVINELV
jgi:hypothetical protein